MSVPSTVASRQAQQSCLGYSGVSALNSNIPLLRHGCCPAPYCKHADMEQWLFNAFLVISTTSFRQEQAKHHSRTASSHDQLPSLPCSSQECNFWLQATEDVKPAPLHLALTLAGRKCLSSATSIRQGLMNDNPVVSCIYIKVEESHWLAIPYHLMVVTAPLNLLSYVTILSLTSCLTANWHQIFWKPYSL